MYKQKLDVDEKELIKLFNDGWSHQKIADHLQVRKGVVTYRLNQLGCSRGKFKSFKNCQLCGKQHKGSLTKYCNTCVSRIRRFNYKRKAVDLKGRRCNRCGWIGKDYEICAYEFHHPDGTKEMAIGQNLNKSWKK